MRRHQDAFVPSHTKSVSIMSTVSKIITPRLELVPASREDLWELWELWQAPAVREPLFGLASLPVDLALVLLDACLIHPQALWMARSRLTSRCLGVLSLVGWPYLARCASALRPHARRGEFAVAFAPSMWGQGYAREASVALLSHAFDSAQLREITAACDEKDTRGLRLLRGLGFDFDSGAVWGGVRRVDLLLEPARFRAATAGISTRRPIAQADVRAYHPADFVATDLPSLQ
jgi:[ribosomal protein S5]-alanine N-acetyltransferase